VAITGDHYVGTYAGHTLELVRNNWHKTLKLLIDGREVASESCALPHDMTLRGNLEVGGARHSVVAQSLVDRLVLTADSIEVDGQVVKLIKTK
jgi:hypothetical protein